jgi:uncharacterized protein (DUF2164 family)
MTARQRRIYWNRERNKAVKYINKYRGKFYRALQSDMQGFQDALQNSVQDARRYVNNLLFSDGISNTLNQLIREVSVKYARDNYNTLRKEKQFGTSEEWVQMIMDYLGTNFYNQGVLQIVQTSRGMMLDILERGNREGWGYYDYARYISETVPGLNQNRADMIARTEVGRAIHAGTFVGADKSPFQKQKMWVAAKDNRTRGNPFKGQKDKADHWHLDGQTVDFNDKFVDRKSGTELEHPHDPQGKAVDVIRCRCTFVIVNKRDANGNLIRKNTGMVLPNNRFVFQSARTITEAEQWAKNNIVNESVDYSVLSIEHANSINKKLFELVNKYGKKIDVIRPIKNLSKYDDIMQAKKSQNAIIENGEIIGQKEFTEIRLNKSFFESYNTSEKLNNLLEKANKAGWCVSKNLEDIVTHEYGHILTKQTRETANDLVGAGLPNISKYAETNLSETIAELFTKHVKYDNLTNYEMNILIKYLTVFL